jgi:hypothetical protein
MEKLLPVILPGTIGIFSVILAILINRYFDKRNKILATKREQLEKVFAPLEVLTKVNKQEFERFQSMKQVSQAERDFIEQSIWYPNHIEIKKIIMSNSHLLSEIPQEFLDLLDHINLWLFVYEEKYTRKAHTGPVYAGPSGKPYPRAADDYIFGKATEYRKILKKKLFQL